MREKHTAHRKVEVSDWSPMPASPLPAVGEPPEILCLWKQSPHQCQLGATASHILGERVREGSVQQQNAHRCLESASLPVQTALVRRPRNWRQRSCECTLTFGWSGVISADADL